MYPGVTHKALRRASVGRGIQERGITEIVLVVKHHDVFVLYPSRYTTRSVNASPWLGGHGE